MQGQITTRFFGILALFLRIWSSLESFGDLRIPHVDWDRFFNYFYKFLDSHLFSENLKKKFSALGVKKIAKT